MAQIVMLDSTKEDLFVCGYCKTIFNSLTLFLDHKREPCSRDAFSDETSFSNLDGTPVQPASRIDPECSYRPPPPVDQTPESSPCKSHNVNIKEVSCKFCGKTFKRSKSLSSHLRSHSGKPYQCLICGKCFAQSSHLKRHESTHRIWPTSLCETTAKSLQADTSSYSCMFCDTILSSYGQFRIHLKKHGSLKQFKCVQQECHNLFGTMDLLLQHVASVHSQAKYFCPLCNKDFSTLEDSAMHQQNHVSPSKTIVETNQFKCSHCDAVFKKKEKLELHIVSENHSKSCVYCGKTFTSHKRLRLHLQIHKNSKPFQCNVCSQSFSLKKYLMSHMLRHSERAFACNMCNYKFKRKDLLQRHMKTHQKKKMLKCPFKEALGCSMEFTRSDKLKLHVKNHTKQMTVNPKRSRRSKESSSTIEIMIVPLDSHKGEGDTDT